MTRRGFLRGVAAFGTVAMPAVAVASECHAGLSTYGLCLRKVLVGMSVEDAITACDRKFVAALDALLRQPGHDGTHVQGGKA